MKVDEPEASWPVLRRASRTVVVVDVVESVRLMEQDEADTVRRWRSFVGEVITTLLPRDGGRLVKSLGDGLMLEFESVVPAVHCALAMQRAIEPYNQGYRPEQCMYLRIGEHVADVVVDEHDIYGSGVNLAARLATLAGPGEIVVSAEVRDQLVPGLDADIEDLGPNYLKHVAQPVQAYRVGPPGAGRALQPRPRLQAMTTGELPLVAVLPFRAPRGQATSALGDLLADNIIVRLSGSGSVRLISRLSAAALGDRMQTVAEIGALLAAEFVVSGTYLESGGRIHLMVELAASSTQEVVWAGHLTGSVDALISPDGDIIHPLCAGISAAVANHELRRVQTHPLPTIEGASLQLAATTLIHRSSVREFDRGREVLEHLVNRYPRAPIPRAWLAKWYVLRVTRGLVEDLGRESSAALDQTRRALDAAPECSLALAMEGFVRCHMLRDLCGAEALLDHAIALNPSEAWAWLFKCVVQGFRGEGESALTSAERAMELSPLDPMHHYFEGLAASAALAARRLPLAIELAGRSLRASRDHLPTLRALAIAQMEAGDGDAGRLSVARIMSLDPSFTISRYLARAPVGSESTRRRYAQALQEGGVPHG